MMNERECKVLRAVIDCLTHDEECDRASSARPSDQIWGMMETLFEYLQKCGVRKHLKSGITTVMKNAEDGLGDYFMTTSAQQRLGDRDQVRAFLSESLQVIEGARMSLMNVLNETRRSLADQLERDGDPVDKPAPFVHSTTDENGVSLVMDCEFKILLIALEDELNSQSLSSPAA